MASERPVTVKSRQVVVSAFWGVALWALNKAKQSAAVAFYSPGVPLLLLAIVGAWWAWGRWPVFTGLALAAVAGGLGFWAFSFSPSFERQVSNRIRATRRSAIVYRAHWDAKLRSCSLARKGEPAPLLRRVTANRHIDQLRLKMLDGQTLDDYARNSMELAQTFGASECRVKSVVGKPQLAELWFVVNDPLERQVNPFPSEPELMPEDGWRVAVTEDGSPWRMKLAGRHWLVAGATGAGKSSVIWSLIYAMIPAIQAGLVKLWVIDPKGGMELSAGQHLYQRFVYGDTPTRDLEFAAELEAAVKLMRRRQAGMREEELRSHVPTTKAPLHVLIIDELAELTSYGTTRASKTRIQKAISILLSQGRAPGFCVIGAMQDPRKDILPMRDLIPSRIAMRVVNEDQVDMVLGDGARSHGAYCDRIPEDLPGVGYVASAGHTDVERVRFAYVTDEMIKRTKAMGGEVPQPGQQEVSVSLPADDLDEDETPELPGEEGPASRLGGFA